uniref:Paired domain-containing protein n=1 Tax=Strongyloides papillosus TaxID=174720 RepID=A0A0N5B7J4_STREA
MDNIKWLEDHYCCYVIDTSTPDALEKSFNAWLKSTPSEEYNNSCYQLQSTVGNPYYDVTKEYPNYYFNNISYFNYPITNDSSMLNNNTTTELSTNISTTDTEKRPPRKRNNHRRTSGTNLYGRPYCPGRPLSMSERCRIIELHRQGMKVNAISKALCVSHGCVSKIISRFRETGLLSPFSNSENRRNRKGMKNSNNNLNNNNNNNNKIAIVDKNVNRSLQDSCDTFVIPSNIPSDRQIASTN